MRIRKKQIALSIVFALSLRGPALLGQAPISDKPLAKPKVVLVELFTSEGCSDCPPADELLRQIDRKQFGSGHLIVGISEHVTYWNSLGWADPFSLAIYDQRQSAYADKFGLNSVYTPQMVVNGSEQFVGSDRAKLAQALNKEAQQSAPVAVQILSASRVNHSLTVTYAVKGSIPSAGLDVIAVVADDADRSSVERGENSGRNLTHVAVARSLTRLARLNAPNETTAQLTLPASYQPSQAHHIIVFAQSTGNGRIFSSDSEQF
jgi:hypothetical protein